METALGGGDLTSMGVAINFLHPLNVMCLKSINQGRNRHDKVGSSTQGSQ